MDLILDLSHGNINNKTNKIVGINKNVNTKNSIGKYI